MNQKHLLNFIKAKLKHEPDEVRDAHTRQQHARGHVPGG